MNDQEKLWQGEFGDAYHQRNSNSYRLDFWLRVLKDIPFSVKSVLELGAGKGDNLAALHLLIPGGTMTGIEINHAACDIMRKRYINVVEKPVAQITELLTHDLVITRGFLIHVPDQDLPQVLKIMYMAARKYICIAEYYAPERRELSYRGYIGVLWQDDFAGKLQEMYPGKLKLIDYGFHYKGDGGDDLTYFVLEKVK